MNANQSIALALVRDSISHHRAVISAVQINIDCAKYRLEMTGATAFNKRTLDLHLARMTQQHARIAELERTEQYLLDTFQRVNMTTDHAPTDYSTAEIAQALRGG